MAKRFIRKDLKNKKKEKCDSLTHYQDKEIEKESRTGQ